MKTFPVKLSVYVYLLLALSILLAMAGVGWNIYNVIHGVDTLNKILSIFTAIVSCAVLVFAVSVAFFSRYVFKGNILKARFGLIYSKYDLKKAVQVTHFKLSDKLVLYFEDATFTTIVISPDNYDSFIKELREKNPLIRYDLDEEENQK